MPTQEPKALIDYAAIWNAQIEHQAEMKRPSVLTTACASATLPGCALAGWASTTSSW